MFVSKGGLDRGVRCLVWLASPGSSAYTPPPTRPSHLQGSRILEFCPNIHKVHEVVITGAPAMTVT
nr:uncharacterized protein CTRU02_02643 [Colletotrichum truncatum]KAF6798669.1 hypothetical protein CTRU02_02643 [Colletotrichum truncatum]